MAGHMGCSTAWSNSVLELHPGSGPQRVPPIAIPVGRHMPNHGQRVAFERQFSTCGHRENVHSGRRILQSDRVRSGADRGHTSMRVSGPIPGTNSGSESSPNVELDLACVSRPILYWK